MPADRAGTQPPTAESLGWQLRAALPPLRLHSVSLYDPAGEVLWLSEGALGPDEQAFVLEALQNFDRERSAGHYERDFGDGRAAVFLAVRSPQAELVGLAMILVDVKALASGRLAARVLSAPVRAVLQQLAILLRPVAPAPAAAPAPALAPAPPSAAPGESATASSSATGPRSLEILEWTPPGPIDITAPPIEALPGTEASGTGAAPMLPGETEDGDAAETSQEVLASQRVDDILSFELAEPNHGADRAGTAPTPSTVSAAGAPSSAATAPATATVPTAVTMPMPRAAGELHVQELARLRPGGRTRRFRVVPKPPLTPEQALFAPLRELGAWLDAHPEVRENASLHFSLAVSAAALGDDGLPRALAEAVGTSGVEPACLGFELAEAACIRERERVERLVRTIEKLGCFLVLDDFTFDTGVLDLLRSRALRLLKVDGALTRGALRDKLAQARVVAISQAARVLGVHCAAKQVDAAATHRWLAAAGFDFAEGPIFRAPCALASLAGEQADRQ